MPPSKPTLRVVSSDPSPIEAARQAQDEAARRAAVAVTEALGLAADLASRLAGLQELHGLKPGVRQSAATLARALTAEAKQIADLMGRR